jgi:hypothetical protein
LKISKMRGLVAGAVTACVVLGSGVATASAAPAVWNASPIGGPTTTTGPIVVKVQKTPTTTVTYTCQPGDISSQSFVGQNQGGEAWTAWGFVAVCAGPLGPQHAIVKYYGPYQMFLKGEKVGTNYLLRGSDTALLTIDSNESWQSNSGRGANYVLPWKNSTNPLDPASTMTFSNTPVGKTASGQIITLTAVVRVKTAANGFITLI